MSKDSKNTVVGALMRACLKFDGVRGGNQKLQKILGSKVYYSSPNGKTWFTNQKLLFEMTESKLKELTEKINKA